MRTCRPIQIRKSRLPTKSIWLGSCNHCHEMKELLEDVPLNNDQQKRLLELQQHNQLARHQIQTCKKQKERLRQKQCLVVMDFSKFYTQQHKVSDLVVVLYWKDVSNNLQWKYLDHFSTEKQTFPFVRTVWLHLLKHCHV